ncbi:MAG TPA: hypothetical protein VFF72_08055 [Caldimonas sp.]|nr:hypothetical protein [Caldimonas sp.]
MIANSFRLIGVATALALAGCGPTTSGASSGAGGQALATKTAGAGPTALPKSGSTPTVAGTAVAAPAVASGREVVNPDKSTMVFLYLALAGLAPPIDDWVEDDARVRAAAPIDKAARRSAVRAELESGVAAARGIGRIRVTLADAGVSDYDPTYQEFTVRSLSPGSELDYSAFGQRVKTRFDNGETAQLWHVPSGQAQAVRDRLSAGRGVELDVLLRVTGAQPGTGGGTITTEIVDYTLRSRDGSKLGRVQVAKE